VDIRRIVFRRAPVRTRALPLAIAQLMNTIVMRVFESLLMAAGPLGRRH
jgi:hypothetical protein